MAQSAAHKHASTHRATYQNVLDAPARLATEIIDGTLHTQPHPALRHARATSRLGFETAKTHRRQQRQERLRRHNANQPAPEPS